MSTGFLFGIQGIFEPRIPLLGWLLWMFSQITYKKVSRKSNFRWFWLMDQSLYLSSTDLHMSHSVALIPLSNENGPISTLQCSIWLSPINISKVRPGTVGNIISEMDIGEITCPYTDGKRTEKDFPSKIHLHDAHVFVRTMRFFEKMNLAWLSVHFSNWLKFTIYLVGVGQDFY